VLDLDGCLYVGDEPVPGARSVLEQLAEAGFRTVFATNNSTKTPQVVAERVEAILDYAIAPSSIVTSAMAAATMLSPDQMPVMAIGEQGLGATLEAAGFAITIEPEEARAVVIGLDRGITYDRLRRATQAVLLGARFIATNEDATFPTGGVPEPGAGSIVAAVERATGQTPEYAGKPNEPMLRCVMALLGPGPTWAVGDRPETDVAFGARSGWTTVLVMTGVTSDPDRAIPRPDHVLESVASLPRLVFHT